jgi:voltage-gated potassium channel Kch
MASRSAAPSSTSDPEPDRGRAPLRRQAYYGDATRLDLLVAAGARKAKLLVVAVDGEEDAMRIVKLARQHFHHLKLIVRAHGRTDAFEYHELGVPAVRETFGSALDAAELALRALDHGPVAARRVVAASAATTRSCSPSRRRCATKPRSSSPFPCAAGRTWTGCSAAKP